MLTLSHTLLETFVSHDCASPANTTSAFFFWNIQPLVVNIIIHREALAFPQQWACNLNLVRMRTSFRRMSSDISKYLTFVLFRCIKQLIKQEPVHLVIYRYRLVWVESWVIETASTSKCTRFQNMLTINLNFILYFFWFQQSCACA